MEIKRILFITTTNLFSNPRLVKELSYFSNKGYSIKVICFKIGTGDTESTIIEKKLSNVEFVHLSALQSPFLPWFISSSIQKFSKSLWLFFKTNLLLTTYASNKRSILINQSLRKAVPNYDLVIAHTLGALYPAYSFSQKHRIPFSFDMEDYHPGELIKTDVENEKYRREILLKNILPNSFYTSFASPLFKTALEKILQKDIPKSVVIHNGFHQHEFNFIDPLKNEDKVQLIWYSLTIAEGRGLEKILPTLAKYSTKVHLTLVGNLSKDFDEKYQISSSSFITHKGFLPQEKLHQLLCEADVGLALEQVDTDLNRNLCLTNKIISYCQAGIYIFASNTTAQKNLIDNYPDLGVISTNFNNDLIVVINDIKKIRANKMKRFQLGGQFSWESEQKKLDELIQHV
ncbi:MAG: hypothetical protein KF732_06035 [Flavobacteriales bacterium]|nr:hypothetical protein [Flavobacteriales bacterium]